MSHLSILFALFATAAVAQHFDPETGLRRDRYRAPTPAEAPGAVTVDAAEVAALAARGAVLVDVFATPTGRWDELDGAWFVSGPRETLPGAVWLPEVGRGAPGPEVERWFAAELARATGGDRMQPLVFFCVSDCWMGWNAAVRAVRLGYAATRWFPGGVDDWVADGRPLAPAWPRPMTVE